MLKKTKVITYNLANRDRKHVGQDRSDVDIQSMVDHINSPTTQELVRSGDLYGYYGHEIRARFGMNPPDVWVNPETGESILIEPAIRTIKLSADDAGNVTSQHEFLDTTTGKYSERLYTNKAGGFSSAVMREMGNAGKYIVKSFSGFDYVRQPNYNSNRGDGMFDALHRLTGGYEASFDSLTGISPERIAIKSALEAAIMNQYDSINNAIAADQMVSHYQNEAMQAQNELIERASSLERLRERRNNRKVELADSFICPSVPFSEATAQWDSFNIMGTSDNDLRTAEKVKESRESAERRDDRPRIFNRY